MSKRGISVPALCAELLLFIALHSATGNNKPGDNKVSQDHLSQTHFKVQEVGLHYLSLSSSSNPIGKKADFVSHVQK